MKDYLQSWIPRLSNFSQELNKISKLSNEPWVLFNDNNDFVKIIFQTDGLLKLSNKGKLTVSKNGIVSDGSWELFTAANSIMLEIDGERKLYNNIFLDKALVILSVDGQNNSLHVFINENEIPDLNVERYLKLTYMPKLQEEEFKKYQKILQLNDGRLFQILKSKKTKIIGSQVHIDGENPEDGFYILKNQKYVYEVVAYTIVKFLKLTTYKQDIGDSIVVAGFEDYEFEVGSPVWCGEEFAKNGKYKAGYFSIIDVKNGRISMIHGPLRRIINYLIQLFKNESS